MNVDKLLFNANLLVGLASIVLMVISITINQPMLVLGSVIILAVSIVCALLNYKAMP